MWRCRLRNMCSYSSLTLTVMVAASVLSVVTGDYRRTGCGQRLSGVRTLNVTAQDVFTTDKFTSDYETFPWLVPIQMTNTGGETPTLLCAGVAISSYVAVAPAHCVVGVQKTRLRAREFEVENLIVHPDYVDGHPSNQHDLAVIKARETPSGNGFEMYACLPDAGDDPVDACQAADYFQTPEMILGHDLKFGPSVFCAEETPHMRGYLDSPLNILCSAQSCSRFVQGPVFCPQDGGGFTVAGLSTGANNWCSVGAYTRLARYSEWVAKTIEYLEGIPTIDKDFVETPRRGDSNFREEGTFAGQTSDELGDSSELEDRPCAKNPCGPHAICWNSGENFLCTCSDPDYSKGNPYQECHECLYDQHCNPNLEEEPYKCINRTCQLDKEREKNVPPEYIKAGLYGHFYISEEELSWPQAQYDCQGREGLLAEVTGSRSVFSKDLLELLSKEAATRTNKTANGTMERFWVGASDLGERGNFLWYNADRHVSDANWSEDGRPDDRVRSSSAGDDKDQRCLQIGHDGKWVAHSCEFKSRYICKYDPASYFESFHVSNPLEEDTTRSDRQRTFFDTLKPTTHYKDVCGRRFVRVRGSRIVGGGIANYGEWPWQVSLKQYKNGQFRHKCGAALLTHQYVITAAHCVKDVSPSNLIVRIGEYNVLDLSETHRHIDKRVKTLIVHSSFDKESYEFDIALLKLSSQVPFQPNIIPICLPSTNNLLVGKTGTVTGWGRRSEYGSISPVLREVHLPIISNKRCMEMYQQSGQNEWIPQIFMCAGTSNGGKDSCEGDSGGPLVVKGRNGRYELAGIISWGIGCGDRNRPGVYTRISEFKNWILQNSNYRL